MVKIRNEPKLDGNSPKKRKKKKKGKKFMKDHSWPEQLPSWMASEVLIKQSAADNKTISGRPGIPGLAAPTPRNLRTEGASTQGSTCAFEGLLFL